MKHQSLFHPDDFDSFGMATNKNCSLLQSECYTNYTNEQNKNLPLVCGMFLIRSQNFGLSQPQRSYKKGSYEKRV